MKRIFLPILLLLLLLLVLPVYAAVDAANKVHDYADLLSADEADALRGRIAAISAEHDFDILILTEEKSGITDTERYANAFFDDYGFGFGEHGDGVMLFINMGERVVSFTTTGRCEPLYERHIEDVLDDVYDFLSDGDFYGAADVFLDDVEVLARRAGSLPDTIYAPDPTPSTPVPGYTGPSGGPTVPELLGQSFLIGLGFAILVLIVLIILQKRSLPKPPSYHTYLAGGVREKHRDDIFVTTHTSRSKIQRNNSSGGGSGGGGGGRSHGGGSRRF